LSYLDEVAAINPPNWTNEPRLPQIRMCGDGPYLIYVILRRLGLSNLRIRPTLSP